MQETFFSEVALAHFLGVVIELLSFLPKSLKEVSPLPPLHVHCVIPLMRDPLKRAPSFLIQGSNKVTRLSAQVSLGPAWNAPCLQCDSY